MRKRASYKGIYKPTNPKKYVGNINHIVYRSLWERKFMVYCDTQENIKHWSSEEFHVVYYNPVTKKLHKYFPDFVIKTNKNENFMIQLPEPLGDGSDTVDTITNEQLYLLLKSEEFDFDTPILVVWTEQSVPTSGEKKSKSSKKKNKSKKKRKSKKKKVSSKK